MKLLFCTNCGDLFKITTKEMRACKCGKAWGQYAPNGWHAVYGGSKAVPLLLSNHEIIRLVSGSIKNADLSKAASDHPRYIHEKKAPKIRCKKCRTVVYSLYRHDYRECACGAVALDGGFDYSRIIGNPNCVEKVKRSTFNGRKKTGKSQD